ncbi:MAG: rhomboid family intramembrane serine protease [Candidatus Methanoperedens sp.]|nr:rhomboid family intramembrane serine protease [Candidatus Methanoperedens sp.]MCZ7394868.1 rhomboid family intramembrane serine protease [Candidatus Methanoperedens sp.]
MKLTNLLILLCTAFSLYAWNTSNNLAFSEYALFHGGYYTLLTGLFVHASLVHLAGNMLFLYVFGSSLENEVGARRTAAVFFTGGILSFVLSIPFYPGADMLGASAAIFAVMAAVLLVRRPGYSIQFLSPLGPLALLYFIFNIASVGSGGNVAYISHVIGFLIGLFFGAWWNTEWKKSLLLTLLLAGYIMLYNYLKVWI